ncbi:MAG: hypothetical protein SOX39_08745 [Selenomonas sp.]|uniref:hypothetical protein n=1 Tax=Selenomonas sp. TaxID=2053611 RepID=UPI002A7EADCE|nr:hypothetical protein [Selenomonas sp.]MDY3297786.1 hypothetical protein [Selenomonas sp.]MDY4415217.1 hypothetical protein [Selenomonas sp.]
MMVWSIFGSAVLKRKRSDALWLTSCAMVAAKDVLVLVVAGILAGSALGILTPPEWVQAILALAIYIAVR